MRKFFFGFDYGGNSSRIIACPTEKQASLKGWDVKTY
jgi:hypothetical protein